LLIVYIYRIFKKFLFLQINESFDEFDMGVHNFQTMTMTMT